MYSKFWEQERAYLIRGTEGGSVGLQVKGRELGSWGRERTWGKIE